MQTEKEIQDEKDRQDVQNQQQAGGPFLSYTQTRLDRNQPGIPGVDTQNPSDVGQWQGLRDGTNVQGSDYQRGYAQACADIASHAQSLQATPKVWHPAHAPNPGVYNPHELPRPNLPIPITATPPVRVGE